MGVVQIPGYRLVRAIGRGGMGSVFLAEKVSTGEPFAIKFLRQDCMEDPAYLTRFEREVTALRAIRHPNVVNVYAWFIPQSIESEERPFVVMDFLDGEGLDKVLATEKKLAPLTATRIMLQVLDGLAAAHQIGVVHRDLGPSNVFLIPRQRGRFHVKILDFGLARSLNVAAEQSELTQQGTLMGKPAYVAPEALTGQPIDGRCDIFGCGILLFRMLTGGFPYRESDSHLLWVERVRDARSGMEYPSPSTVTPDVPQALDRIVVKATRTRVADRYATVEAMQEDLLEVETALLGDSSPSADWSSSRPGIPSLSDPPSGSGASLRLRTSSADATPTIAGSVVRPTLVGRRKRMVLGGVAASVVAVAVLVVALFRDGGPVPTFGAGVDGGGIVAAGAPEADAAVSPVVDVVAVAPSAAAGRPDGAPVKVTEPDVVEAAVQALADGPADAGPERVVVIVRGAPRSAVIRVGGVVLTGDPPTGRVPPAAAVDMSVQARGFEPYREQVALEGDREFVVRLRRAGEGTSTPRDAGRVHGIPSVPDEPF